MLVLVATKRAGSVLLLGSVSRSRPCSDSLSALPTSVQAIWLAPHGASFM